MKPDAIHPLTVPHFGRGDLRFLLLRVLSDRPMHGYDIMKLLESRFQGAYKPSAGSVYPALRRLVRDGHAVVDRDRGRNVYRITPKGRSIVSRQEAEFEERLRSFEASIGPERAAVFREARSLMKHVRLSAATMTPAQARKLSKLLAATRKRVMETLAE